MSIVIILLMAYYTLLIMWRLDRIEDKLKELGDDN